MEEYRRLKYTIVKKGRKWFQAKQIPKGYVAQIEINDVSKDWKEGEDVEFYGKLVLERSRFGTKAYVYPVPEEKVKEVERMNKEKKLEEYRRKIEEAFKNGWFPSKTAESYLSLAEELGRKDEAEKYVEQVRSEVSHRNAVKKYDELKEKIENITEKDREKYLNNLVKWIEELKDRYQDIAEDYKKSNITGLIEEKRNLVRRGALKRDAEGKLRRIEEDIKEKGYPTKSVIEEIDNYIATARKNGWKDIDKMIEDRLGPIIEEQEIRWKKFYENANPETLELLRGYFSDAEIMRISKKIDITKEYVKLNFDRGGTYLSVCWDVIKDKLGGVALSRVVRDRNSPLGRTEYIFLVPAENYALARKVMEELRPAKIYSLIQTAPLKSEPMSDGEMMDELPTSWNHLKREFVGVLTPDLRIEYISERRNYTRSGANAELYVDSLPDEKGSLLLTYSGSHRHKYLNMYRRDEDGWRFVMSVEGNVTDLVKEFLKEAGVADMILAPAEKEEEEAEL